VPRNGKEIPCGVKILCPSGLGGGVGVAGGGEEIGLPWSGRPELPLFCMACFDDGNSFGLSWRTRVYQVLQGRIKVVDCPERWQQRWPVLRGGGVWVGWSKRVCSDPGGSRRLGLAQVFWQVE
jgi:hypothetical protein